MKNQRPKAKPLNLLWFAVGLGLFQLCACSPNEKNVAPDSSNEPNKEFLIGQKTPFKIFWPPAMEARSPKHKPILTGNLCVSEPGEKIQIQFEISRPESEDDRNRWNRALAFPEYSWMSRVRVWDKDKKWLWPNLHCLLTAHGRKRSERYGGIDPGKGVDNDYAAILIRRLDTKGNPIQPDSERPLVSAEWFPDDPSASGKIELVSHVAMSDRFSIHLNEQGSLGVWLIYADFLESKPPKSWPQEQEFAGGILVFFEVRWKTKNGKVELDVKQAIPRQSTGFDWRKWSTHAVPFKKKLK